MNYEFIQYRISISSWLILTSLYRQFGKKRVALASFPRSGNTWIRYMVEMATELPSGSIYHDRILPRGKKGVIIKTHDLDSYRYTHAIHLIRNPFDAIESYYHWKKKIAQNVNITWDEHVNQSVLQWKNHTEHWIQSKCEIFNIRYEDLLDNPLDIISSLLSWIGYSIKTDKLLDIIDNSNITKMRKLDSQIGLLFFRQGKSGEGIKRFSEEQRNLVVKSIGHLMRSYGYYLI